MLCQAHTVGTVEGESILPSIRTVLSHITNDYEHGILLQTAAEKYLEVLFNNCSEEGCRGCGIAVNAGAAVAEIDT